MLSNTADTKPSPNRSARTPSAGARPASGWRRTPATAGMPSRAARCGRPPSRAPAPARSPAARPTPPPQEREVIGGVAQPRIDDHVGRDRHDQDREHDRQPRPVELDPRHLVLEDRLQRCCCSAAGMPETSSAVTAAMKAGSTASGETPASHIIVVVVSPTTLPEPPALGRRDDRRQEADVQLVAEHHVGHRRADQRRRDVVEEGRHTNTMRAAPARRASRRAEARQHVGHPLSSKCRDSSANPTSRPSRLASVTHSCPRCANSPPRPGRRGKPANSSL